MPLLSFDQPLALALLLLAAPLAWLAFGSRLRHGEWQVLKSGLGLQLALRMAILTCLSLALAGPTLRLPKRQMDVMFAADVSDSVTRLAPAAAASWLSQADGSRPHGDEAGLLTFAATPSVVTPPTSLALPRLVAPAGVEGQPTDIAQAIRSARGLFLPGQLGRIVVLSDGQEVNGDALVEAAAAHAAGLQVDTVALGQPVAEVVASSLATPSSVHVNEGFDATFTVSSNTATSGVAQLLADGKAVDQRDVSLAAGDTPMVLHVPALPAGRHILTGQVVAHDDTLLDDNQVQAVVDVQAAPSVLLLEGAPGDAQWLAQALTTEGLHTVRQDVASADFSGAGLRPYDAVVLANVPAWELTDDRLAALRLFVRDLGHGLLVTGGDQAFGAGGYAQSAMEDLLPVSSLARPRRLTPSVALDVVIDRSGSMYGDKLDAAKRAASLAIQDLQPGDEAGVLAFDYEPTWVVPQAPLDDPSQVPGLLAAINGIAARGGTNIYDALQTAGKDMQFSQARIKHIVLLTDGEDSTAADQYGELAASLQRQGVTVSTVAIGADADTAVLQLIAKNGGGRAYTAASPDDVPGLVFEDTRRVAAPALFDGSVTPELTRAGQAAGVSSVPVLAGYDPTVAKPTSEVLLARDNGDPLLASWRLGLGKVAVWTSDVRNRWAASWAGQPGFGRFWSQVLGDVLPSPASVGLQPAIAVDGDRATLSVDVREADGSLVNGAAMTAVVLAPDGKAATLPLAQAAPGAYQAAFSANEQGVYGINVARDGAGGVALSYAVGWPAEDRALGPNVERLQAIARAGGGSVLTSPAEAFARDGWASTPVEPWPVLAGLALFLFLFELAVRRFGVAALLGRRPQPTPELLTWTALRDLAERGAQSGGFATRDQLIGKAPLVTDAASKTARRRLASTRTTG